MFILGYHFQSFACSCETETFHEACKSSDEIFIGRVLKIEAIDSYQDYGMSISNNLKVTFEVSRKWKGNSSKTIELYFLGTSCDFHFSIYEIAYLVYATEVDKDDLTLSEGSLPDKFFTTSICSRNVEFFKFMNFNSHGVDDVEKLSKKYKDVILK